MQRLFEVCEPPRQELLRRLNLAPGGTRELVRMREDLLHAVPEEPELKPVDRDFRHLFGSWFNRGFLVMRRIDWTTSAAVLEKLIQYEAVHAIRDWEDLRRRLDPRDRRCFGFFHPALGDEPLIFVEVALTNGIPDRIQGIINAGETGADAGRATTAAFFGISNCQYGLRGISFGSFLLKQVVQELKAELPHLARPPGHPSGSASGPPSRGWSGRTGPMPMATRSCTTTCSAWRPGTWWRPATQGACRPTRWPVSTSATAPGWSASTTWETAPRRVCAMAPG